MGLFLVCISGLFLLFGSIRTESGVDGALIYNKEADGPYRTFTPRDLRDRDPLSVLDGDQPQSRFYPLEFQQSQPEAFFLRSAFSKRADKGILLDVGDYVINGGGPRTGERGDPKSFLLKSPTSVLRVGGMMRNSG